MWKTNLLILVIFACIKMTAYPQSDNDFAVTKIVKGLTAELPKDFEPMPEGEMAQQYVSYRKPMAMYTSPDREADFGVNMALTEFNGADLNIMKEFYQASIMNFYSKVDIIDSGIKEHGGNKYVYFEFVASVEPDENSLTNKSSIRQYNYIQYTVFNGKTFVLNFNCRERYQSRWQEKAHHIMETVRFKKSNKG